MQIEIINFEPKTARRIPMFAMSVAAGNPIPVTSDIEEEIDLNELLVTHPAATFFARVKGNDMENSGIKDGDILIVDTAIEPTNSRMILVSLGGNLAIKFYKTINGQIYIESLDNSILPMQVGNMIDYKLLGVITNIIHSIK